MKVGIIMGSKSDLPVVEKASQLLDRFGVENTMRILSAHRTLDAALDFVGGAEEEGYGVIIAAAGKAAHLPGVLAAATNLPVIGIPMKTSMMGGMDSVLSILQMPAGIPVATVGVDAAENAALLALRILALTDKELASSYRDYVEEMKEKVLKDDEELVGRNV
ncbi:MAG: 5-(carboxyamino)imidazole ribonucleotide mutase [Tissierellia bacterium]|nr:5-(carboxyamino)imidazole ribonucleotide mutase [Tissierellia bacterium]